MMLFQEAPVISTVPNHIHRHFNELLADEYVLMNKTVNLLLCLPIVPEPKFPEAIYDELKKNIKEITAFLKSQELPIQLSINNFLEQTRLASSPAITSCAAWFNHIISDHQFIIARISEALLCLTTEDEVHPVFNVIRERHEGIVSYLLAYGEPVEEVNFASVLAG